LLIIICTSTCYNNSALKVSKFDGQDFISCNIDKIKDTFNLKLSDIAEYSEVVVLSNDSTLKVEDYQIERVVVSDKYIVVMPRSTPALLYTRKGKFIKKLKPLGSPKSEKLCGIHAQIDDEKDMVYLLVCGLKLLRFNVNDFDVVNIPKAVEKSMDFVFFDNDKMFATYHNDQNIWGYIQSIHSPQAEYLHSRSVNNLFNYMSSSWGKILKWNDTIVLSFASVNDTSYYYNKRNKTFEPFLCCFSPKNSIKFKEQIENSPELLELAASGILKNNKLLKKRLLFINERYCLFRLFDGTRRYYVIDKHNQQAYFLDKIINDFCGDLEMDYANIFEGWRYVNNKDGYLTFTYSINQLKEKLKELKTETSNKTFKNKLLRLINENENDSCIILFISKLEK
jgi:hypothetical protein